MNSQSEGFPGSVRWFNDMLINGMIEMECPRPHKETLKLLEQLPAQTKCLRRKLIFECN
ncbi:hypothetical protein [Marinobacterium nitratireducens]|uniref:hypothetical protein n=1 Tax=Marinobacterium nitratireducens TaxID=518897 RepID=UPI00166A9B96|nr:hypothetical protein [Marinobacterium nitratireducens]